MDFGIGFISNNIMLPILDFFYGVVPSYGFAIVALTLVVRFAVYPLSAGQIRNMRRMKISQPLMQKRVKEVQERYKNDPAKLQQEMSGVYKEYGNPLAGCFPLLLQMPILFALFATLRGSPFADINYNVNLQILPQEQIERIAPQPFTTKPQNIYVDDGVHYQVAALLPGGSKLGVGETTTVEFQTTEGKPLDKLVTEYNHTEIKPQWKITKGEERIQLNEDGTITTLELGDVTLQGTVPGIAANKGFLFIEALGRVGAVDDNGSIHWDILGMVLFFGVSLYVNQLMTGQQNSSDPNAQQQQAITKLTPIIFSGMFLFFPLPAGVLMYIVIANVFQTIQTFFLMREPLPENLQKIVEKQEQEERKAQGRDALPFEKRSKKKEKTSG